MQPLQKSQGLLGAGDTPRLELLGILDLISQLLGQPRGLRSEMTWKRTRFGGRKTLSGSEGCRGVL